MKKLLFVIVVLLIGYCQFIDTGYRKHGKPAKKEVAFRS